MDVSVNLPPELQQATQEMVQNAIETAVAQELKKNAYRPYMTQKEACKYLHVAPSTFNRWIRNYKIPVVQIEGVKRYKKDSLDRFMEQIEQ